MKKILIGILVFTIIVSLINAKANQDSSSVNDKATLQKDKKAINQNSPEEIYNLGIRYLNGKDVKKDMKMVYKLFLRSANMGYARAQYNMGILYLKGISVKQDNQKAFKWFEMASQQNLPEALYAIGLLYEEGKGVKKDIKKALGYYLSAANLGEKRALERIEKEPLLKKVKELDRNGMSAYRHGNYLSSFDYFQKSLAIRERVLGKEHPDTAKSYKNSRAVYDSMRDHEKEFLARREKALRIEHLDTTISNNNIRALDRGMPGSIGSTRSTGMLNSAAPESAPEEEIIPSYSDKKEIVYDESYGTTTKEMVNKDGSTRSLRRSAAHLDHGQVFYEKGNHTIVDILYGTDRQTNTIQTDLEQYYTGERGKLKFGVAQVSIPKKHEFGKMERPNKYLFWQKEKIGEHVIVTKLENINKEAFHTLLKNKLNNVEEKDILIFIHGFNVTFASAIRRTAQLSYDLNFKGVPMTYSWPSRGKVNEYTRDETSIQYTIRHLVVFLKNVIENKENSNIHIIGHSMGTRALINALSYISKDYPEKHVFKNIILAAPDIDRDVFRELLPIITKTTDKITLYASSDDKALKASNSFHLGKRIGEGGNDVFVYEGFDTIDASGIDTSLLGHSYFAEKEILVGDLKEVIVKSLPPAKRKSLMEKLKAKLAYWKFRLDN